MNIYSLDKLLYRLLATVTYAKGDRVIINYGTARAPEYYPATVLSLRAGLMYVLFDDQTKEKYRAVAGKVGLVGHAKTTRKRVTPIPISALENWLLVPKTTVKKKVITPQPAVVAPKPPPIAPPQKPPIAPPQKPQKPQKPGRPFPPVKPKPVEEAPPRPIALQLDYRQKVYLQDSAEGVWKVQKERLLHSDNNVYGIYLQEPKDAEFYSITSVLSLQEAILKIKRMLATRHRTILQHKVVND